MTEERIDSGSVVPEKPSDSAIIKIYKPSDLTDDVVRQLKLRDLVASDLPIQDPKTIKDSLESLCLSPRIYIAQSELDGSAVGSIAIEPWTTGTELGDAYWENVEEEDKQFIIEGPLVANIVSDAQTLPAWQRKGIQRKLWETLIAQENPHVLLGQTQNPAAVMSRAVAAEKSGYRTFFELNEVTPNSRVHGLTVDEERRLSGIETPFVYLAAPHHFGIPINGEGLLTSVPKDILFPTVLNITEFPPFIQGAFAHLIRTQQRINSDKKNDPLTVLGPLVSIRKDVLSK